MIHICGPKDAASPGALVINTTSRSRDWGQAFSPFLLGPVDLYGEFVAQNVENAWQYSKVYGEHVDVYGNPTEQYFAWAKTGWESKKADRYPMGKGRKPKYSYWDGKSYPYVEARKKIYIPTYSKAVAHTEAFQRLSELAATQEVWLWDFDGYDHEKQGMTIEEVADHHTKKCGHAFVLKMMLTCGGLEQWSHKWWADQDPEWVTKARIARNKYRNRGVKR